MKFAVHKLMLATGWPFVVILNENDARALGVHPFDRLNVRLNNRQWNTVLDVAKSGFPVKPGQMGVFEELSNTMGSREGTIVSVTPAPKPTSLRYIKKKMAGFQLNRKEIFEIVKDITERHLTDIEMTYFVTAFYINTMTENEIVWLTDAMVRTGRRLDFGRGKIVDKHCIGGIPGNRTTMIIVPIIAANGFLIPKTSSRSITSPAGTADTMEVLADVALDIGKFKRIVKKVGGCIAWGGSVSLAPADDQIIRIEHPLSIDAEGQLIASVLAKKASVGSTHLLIDIPYGLFAKCKTLNAAKRLGDKFLSVGNRFGLKTHVVLTEGIEPIGNGIGPALEAIDVMKVLANARDAPLDLKAKSLYLAGVMLEMVGRAQKGKGFELARATVESGMALKKMNEIIDAQGRRVKDYSKIQVGEHRFEHCATHNGTVKGINLNSISSVAQAAGAPLDKGAGILLHKHIGDKVRPREKIFTVYAESKFKLVAAKEALKDSECFDY